MKTIDLNADIGEGFPWDEALLEVISSANIGCGGHAGSFRETRRIAILADAHGLNIGAHPGYPDRENMGRKSPEASQVRSWVDEVLVQLDRFTGSIRTDYVKPHGALYHDLLREVPEVCEPFTEWLAAAQLPLMGMKGTNHEQIANLAEVQLISEGFAERRYTSEGTLLDRSHPDSSLFKLEEIQAQAVALAGIGIQSICVHGDREDAVAIAKGVRAALEEAGFQVP